MLWHCDALDPNREVSKKFGKVRLLNLDTLPREIAQELAVFMATPGFLPEHFDYFFMWKYAWQRERAKQVQEYFAREPSTSALAAKNAASVDFQDGLQMLALILDHSPGYHGTVPVWVTLALTELWGRGARWEAMKSRFGVGETLLRKWRDQPYEPLSMTVWV